MGNTVQGYEADPAEVAALTSATVAEVLESMEGITDPLARYTALCAEQVLQVAVRRAVESEIVRLRGVELRRIADAGATYEQIAVTTGLGTKGRVNQLIAAKPE